MCVCACVCLQTPLPLLVCLRTIEGAGLLLAYSTVGTPNAALRAVLVQALAVLVTSLSQRQQLALYRRWRAKQQEGDQRGGSLSPGRATLANGGANTSARWPAGEKGQGEHFEGDSASSGTCLYHADKAL